MASLRAEITRVRPTVVPQPRKRQQPTPPPPPPPPPPTALGGRFKDEEELLRHLTLSLGAMMDAKLAALNDRLLPETRGNLNHCATAQDLLVQSMAQWGIQLAVVAEPYYVPPRSDWAGDLDGLVAIIVRTAAACPPLAGVVRGRGYVAATIGEIVVVGGYFSPNRRLADFEGWIEEVGTVVARSRPRPVLVLGDFNAKSVSWGSPNTCARGEALEEWAIEKGLVVLNRGSVHTCVRQQGGSIVDVTFASPELARRVRDWRVVTGVETLSDHRYIRFSRWTANKDYYYYFWSTTDRLTAYLMESGYRRVHLQRQSWLPICR
ncbi:hypothetical protein K1T71_005328 [Dendrolimus kikuchii]|uniref:Uncharacterized protein n=1 Tax=Dendrolimus kikuchii TaxID=765133 RepID=A0ACC1D724_9NEOP|nr:hypothetical protein K1T71_005328 [Dendrolimus kikuchii]